MSAVNSSSVKVPSAIMESIIISETWIFFLDTLCCLAYGGEEAGQASE